MIDVIKGWFQRYFSDPQAIVLAILLILGFTLVLTWGKVLAPLFASIIIAYMLQWMVSILTRQRVPKMVAIVGTYVGFFSMFFIALLVLWPIAWGQMSRLIADAPEGIKRARAQLMRLPELFPEYFSTQNVNQFMEQINSQISQWSQSILTFTISSIPMLIEIAIYVILVPLMVFFFLKDHDKIIKWCTSFLPNQRPLLNEVWEEVDLQIGNYIRGKFAEVLIIGTATYLVFLWLGMPYTLLLAVMVGLSVFVPYVGAIVVTIPVLLVAYFKWGFEAEFVWVTISYLVIQVLDGNLLVPLLFSEAVNLHPVAIIIAILVFGGLWGFWGVFFAIPLATLVKAVLNAWPRNAATPGL